MPAIPNRKSVLNESANHSTGLNSDSHALLIQECFSLRSSREVGHAVVVCQVSPHTAILGKGVDPFLTEVSGSISIGPVIVTGGWQR
jgi:hypothetical protein